ncbi:hypothetical protein TNCV_1590561 [Trichonephila clavipes]|nr:hypothetical protein TNCV_1590561 [Trichonephila clavipes]
MCFAFSSSSRTFTENSLKNAELLIFKGYSYDSGGLSSFRALGEDLRAPLAVSDPRRGYWIQLCPAYLDPSGSLDVCLKHPMDKPALSYDYSL